MITDLVTEEINMELVYRQVEDSLNIMMPIKEEYIKEEEEVVNSDRFDVTQELAYKQAKLYLLSTRVFQKVGKSLELNQRNVGVKTYSLVKVK